VRVAGATQRPTMPSCATRAQCRRLDMAEQQKKRQLLGSVFDCQDLLRLILDLLELDAAVGLMQTCSRMYYPCFNEAGMQLVLRSAAAYVASSSDDWRREQRLALLHRNVIFKRAHVLFHRLLLCSSSTTSGSIAANATDLVYRRPELFA